jgi:hypothetical protein
MVANPLKKVSGNGSGKFRVANVTKSLIITATFKCVTVNPLQQQFYEKLAFTSSEVDCCGRVVKMEVEIWWTFLALACILKNTRKRRQRFLMQEFVYVTD